MTSCRLSFRITSNKTRAIYVAPIPTYSMKYITQYKNGVIFLRGSDLGEIILERYNDTLRTLWSDTIQQSRDVGFQPILLAGDTASIAILHTSRESSTDSLIVMRSVFDPGTGHHTVTDTLCTSLSRYIDSDISSLRSIFSTDSSKILLYYYDYRSLSADRPHVDVLLRLYDRTLRPISNMSVKISMLPGLSKSDAIEYIHPMVLGNDGRVEQIVQRGNDSLEITQYDLLEGTNILTTVILPGTNFERSDSTWWCWVRKMGRDGHLRLGAIQTKHKLTSKSIVTAVLVADIDTRDGKTKFVRRYAITDSLAMALSGEDALNTFRLTDLVQGPHNEIVLTFHQYKEDSRSAGSDLLPYDVTYRWYGNLIRLAVASNGNYLWGRNEKREQYLTQNSAYQGIFSEIIGDSLVALWQDFEPDEEGRLECRIVSSVINPETGEGSPLRHLFSVNSWMRSDYLFPYHNSTIMLLEYENEATLVAIKE